MNDGRRKRIGRSAGSALLVVLAGAFGGASAQEQIATDPTRPPAAFAAEAPRGAVAGSQLQSVMISPTRRAAIINGVVVELGGKYGDAVLMRVAEDEVVLKSGDSRQVLKLHPAVEKVAIVQAEPVAPAAVKSELPKPKVKAKAKAKAKSKAKPKATAQPTANPATDGTGSKR